MEYLKNNLLAKIFNQQQKAKVDNGVVGISATAHNIAMAHIIGSIPGEIFVQSYRCVHTHDRQMQLQAVQEYVEEFRLLDFPCSYVLPLDKYVMGMIASPDVAQNDMQESVRFAVKDFVDYPITEAVIDVFQLPFKRIDDNKDVSYAVLAHTGVIDEVAVFVQAAGLRLKYIDIQELCLRNLAMLHAESSKGAVLLRLHEYGGNLVLMHNNSIFMSRRIDLPVKDLLAAQAKVLPAATIAQTAGPTIIQPALEQPKTPTLLDALSLDLHRSIDYCSSIFRQSPIDCIILAPTEFAVSKINDGLAENLNMTVHLLNLPELLRFKLEIHPIDQAKCLLAFGAALRQTAITGG